MALHHVHDLETKTTLYRAIHDALSPGGVLLSLDAAVTEPRGHFASWAEDDRYFPLDVELDALQEAGFDEGECFWRRGLCAATCALRAR